VRDAGVAAVGAADVLARPAFAARGRRRPTVAVFGGGIAGLTAAHELAERGFDVTVYERRAWGGKARSTWVPHSGRGGRKPLPGEHGFRFALGFYRHLPDTMRRIPFGSNEKGVWGNIHGVADSVFARDGARPDLYVPNEPTVPMSLTPERILGTLMVLFANPDLPPDATAHFAGRLVVFLSSCDARRHQQWENVTWTDFLDADRYGGDYRRLFGELPRFGQASKGQQTSTDWIGTAGEALVHCTAGRLDGPFWRLLNGPTNEKWIDPWIAHLRSLGVRLRLGEAVRRLEVHRGRIVGAQVMGPRGMRTVTADWYVCALPVERARRLWSERLLTADPKLGQMRRLSTGWMNGMKLFLSENRPIAKGPVGYFDGPWAMGSVNQAQFWDDDFASTYGDGRVKDSLSVIISDWTSPGVLTRKPARDCTPRELIHEVWEQIKRAVNKPDDAPKLTDDMLLSWDIDPGMHLRNGHLVSGDRLNLPTVGERRFRPDVVTAIPNLMLAGDYLLGDWLVGTMEAANETGRRAANAILERSASREHPIHVVPHDRLPEWAPLQKLDEERYRRGQPNLFDTEMTPAAMQRLLTADLGVLERVSRS
jgi:uncharacterized protein with NAD-binding domain and iron-sulfur cluster